MANHSQWAGDKNKKAVIETLRLRYAIDDANAVSMPKNNAQRANKRGTGELDGGNLEEILHEGDVSASCKVLTASFNLPDAAMARIAGR